MAKASASLPYLKGLKKLAKTTFIGHVIFDRSFEKLLFVNKAACEILGVTDGCDDATLRFFKSNMNFVLEYGFTIPAKIDLEKADGKKIRLKFQCFYIEGSQDFILIQFIDVTRDLLIEEFLSKVSSLPSVTEGVLKRKFGIYLAEKYQLTSTEVTICQYILSQKASKDIAKSLYISISTVNTHRRNIRRKLALSKNESLIHRLNTIYVKIASSAC